MSMSVSSKVGYPSPLTLTNTTPTPAPVTANAAAPAPAAAPPPPPPPAPVDTFQAAPVTASANPVPTQSAADPSGADNIFANEQLTKGNWATDTVPLRQANDIDCGAAVATMLAGAKNPLDAQAQSQLMDNLQSKYGTDKGTTPDQMKDMLANVGVEVRRGDAKLDPLALAGTLSQGGKTAAMVDSNKIRPDGDGAPGQAHWVVVDGMNDKNEYRVRDPSDGSSYYVSQEKLAAAMEGARSEHNGGGMLFVESANSNATADQLLAASSGTTDALGDGSGTGSSRNKFLESSGG